jgi:hypothetical protein
MNELPMKIRRRWWWKLQLARATSPLWRVKAWRYLQYWRHQVDGCTCTFEDIDHWQGQVGHPTRGCPKRDDCGGWGWSPPCGGCDRCIEDQLAYYEAKDKGEIV